MKRVLAVDDEPAMGVLIKDVLAGLDFEVEVLESGRDFMSFYDEFAPDIIVLDVVMPDMDGLELLQFLAKKECGARIIIVSGYDQIYLRSATKIAEALDLQLCGQLTKPVRAKELRAAIVGETV